MSFISSLFSKKKTEDMIQYNRRREPRHSCEINTDLLDFTGKQWDCKIVDMSERGLGISTPAILVTGSYLSIVKPNIMAVVLWSRDNRAGLKPIK
jgi:hypothetical protein